MRAIFSAFLLIISILFLIQGSQYNYTNSTGQVGAGYFPIWIGILLVMFTSIALINDVRELIRSKYSFYIPEHFNKLIIVIGLTSLFIALLNVLGALIVMMLYVFAVLFVLNRDKISLNLILSIIIPTSIYLLLEVWLNAGLPQSPFGF